MATEIKIRTYNDSIIHLSSSAMDSVDILITKKNGTTPVEGSVFLTSEDKRELVRALEIL